MSSQALVEQVIDAFHALGVPYMLTGSLANMLYAKPRLTADADFVVVLDRVSINEVARLLPPTLRLDPQMSFETATVTTRYKFRDTETGFAIELFLLSDSPHDRERFRRRRLVPMWDRQVHVPTAEDVVVTKLQWLTRSRRSKDRDDVERVLEAQADRLDWDYIRHWCGQHGTLELLEQIRAQLP